MKNIQDNDKKKELEVIVKFLERTKEGEYASIEESSLPFARLDEMTEAVEVNNEDYYYGMS